MEKREELELELDALELRKIAFHQEAEKLRVVQMGILKELDALPVCPVIDLKPEPEIKPEIKKSKKEKNVNTESKIETWNLICHCHGKTAGDIIDYMHQYDLKTQEELVKSDFLVGERCKRCLSTGRNGAAPIKEVIKVLL